MRIVQPLDFRGSVDEKVGAILQLKEPMPLFSPRSSGSKRAYWLAPLIFLGGFIVFAKLTNTNPPTNSVQTSPDNSDLKTRVYKSTPEAAAQKITSIALSTYGRSWKLSALQHISSDEARMTFRVPVIIFTDILTVSVTRKNDEEIEVNVESHSQIGKGDFGENRRHAQQILAELDRLFA